jgi:hypothetical protein
VLKHRIKYRSTNSVLKHLQHAEVGERKNEIRILPFGRGGVVLSRQCPSPSLASENSESWHFPKMPFFPHIFHISQDFGTFCTFFGQNKTF